ncbi:delta-class carbonic anhydrase [Alteromonas sp. ASW11-36]|uniref:Delta-class carbonic anhydrase n=1 Tax=Alteromonas arenosi TaxID=3055817 RepID=A0ABT7T175_9ALTE|nr:delta-class carbonic anhydrase [Alteromonas sp. ASW11-36]MDM7862182.1 delta-class carbonic anhydrase [Alteromonas sp. ASW11-36]
MKLLNKKASAFVFTAVAATVVSAYATAKHSVNHIEHVSDEVIAQQRAALAANTEGKGFGPQSPRDLGTLEGENNRHFGMQPGSENMNLCNIHFHKNAEHKGGEFTTYAGNGDGKGFYTGYKYDGTLTEAQLRPVAGQVCGAKGHPLQSGDTLEVHFVYTSAQVTPGPTLGACLSDSVMNPGLRVEGQVIVLANDENAIDFADMAAVGMANGYHQAVNIPTDTGTPITYWGSTTGPSYNEKASPLHVTWSVRPEVAVVDINSVGKWCEDNQFDEDHAHGVRNLVVNPNLISDINQ